MTTVEKPQTHLLHELGLFLRGDVGERLVQSGNNFGALETRNDDVRHVYVCVCVWRKRFKVRRRLARSLWFYIHGP